jgi:hypothetical protein
MLFQNRRRLLSDAIKLYRFYRECDEYEIWAKETDAHLNEAINPEHVEASRRKFDVKIIYILNVDCFISSNWIAILRLMAVHE